MKKYPWMKIDTAAVMFSSLSSPEWGRTFHLSAYFNETVNPELLKKACEDIKPYFPSMFAYLKKGFFWNYLALTENLPEICSEDEKYLCPIVMREDKTPDFRLTYSDSRITLDCSHSIADGMGAGRFAEALIARYNALMHGETGEYIAKSMPYENMVNAFDENYDPDGAVEETEADKAFHFDEKYENQPLKTVFVQLQVDDIKKLAKEKGLTVTEYFVSVLIQGIIRSAGRPIDEPVTIGVPVSLRRFFPSKTVRNFTIQSYVSFLPEGREDCTLDEICDAVRGQLKKQLVPERIQKTINKYGSLVNNPVLRVVPNVIKLPVLQKKQRDTHESLSSIFTNVGLCTLPESLAGNITALEFINGDTSRYGLSVTTSCISYNGVMTVCFSHSNNNTALCDTCVEILTSLGLDVKTCTRERKDTQTSAVKEKEPFTAEKIKAYFNI